MFGYELIFLYRWKLQSEQLCCPNSISLPVSDPCIISNVPFEITKGLNILGYIILIYSVKTFLPFHNKSPLSFVVNTLPFKLICLTNNVLLLSTRIRLRLVDIDCVESFN